MIRTCDLLAGIVPLVVVLSCLGCLVHPYIVTVYTAGVDNILTAPTTVTADNIPSRAIPVEVEPAGTTWRMKTHGTGTKWEESELGLAPTLMDYIW